MDNKQRESGSQKNEQLWNAAENLISPDPDIRDSSLDRITEIDGFHQSPLIAYMLVSRICEPDLETRFHLVQLLGALVDFESPGQHLTDQALIFAKEALDLMEREPVIKLLEVSERYISAEKTVGNILKLSSYAGKVLSGIVNDRKLPVTLRQQAVFYCGAVGYMSSKPALQNLVQRVDKSRSRPGGGSERTKSRDEEFLYPFVVSALAKLNP